MEDRNTEIVDRKDLLLYLVELAQAGATGVLALHDAENTTSVRFAEGRITAATWGGEPEGFLLRLAASGGWVSPKALRRARRRLRRGGTTLAAALAREGKLLTRRLRERVVQALEEELWRLSVTEGVWWRFHGEEDPGLFDPEVLGLGLRVDTEALVAAIAGREGNWEVLRRVFPDDLAVLVTRESCRRYFDAPAGQYEEERQVLVLVDGERDVEEIVQASPYDPFRTLRLLHGFLRQGEVRELNPAELIQVAAACRKKGCFDKCLRLYLRAEALGQGAFDLDLTIGNLYESMGQEEEAFRRYRAYAERAARGGEREAAKEGYRRALRLRPSSLELREALADLLDVEAEREERIEAERALLRLARSLQDHGRMERALRHLIAAGAASPEELKDYLRSLVHARGSGEALPALVRLAGELRTRGRARESALVLEAAARLRPEDEEVLRALAESLAEAGDTAGAVQAYERLAAWYRQRERREDLEGVYGALLELDPGHEEALRHRARCALEAGDRDGAVAVLRRLAAALAAAGRRHRRRAVLARLVRLVPEDTALRVDYAEALAAAGRRPEAARALRRAAARCRREAERREEAVALYERALGLEPFDRAARRELARLLEELGREDAARREWETLAETCLLAGEPREAARIFAHLARLRPEECDYVRRAARAWARLADTEEGRRELQRLLKRLVRLEDYGFARWLVHKCGRPPVLRAVLADLPDRRRFHALAARVQRLEERLRRRRDRWRRLAAACRAGRPASPPQRESPVCVSPRDGGSSLVRKMATTREIPGSILEIARKLKGLQ